MLKLTIVICTYNRADLLKDCLDAAIEQTVSKEKYEIVVVDNNSKDHTKKTTHKFIEKHDNVHYFFEEKQGLSHARNRGAKESQMDWLLYLDDDGLAASNMVERALSVIEKHTFDCVGGTYTAWHKYPIPKWLPDDFGTKELLSDELSEIQEAKLDGGLFLIKKQALFDVGLFSSQYGMSGKEIGYGEETELQLRLLEKGYRLAFDPELRMEHLVAKVKHSVAWHLKAAYASGKSFARMTKQTDEMQLHKTVILLFIKAIRMSFPKLFKGKYYVQNFILDVFKPIYFYLGQRSS